MKQTKDCMQTEEIPFTAAVTLMDGFGFDDHVVLNLCFVRGPVAGQFFRGILVSLLTVLPPPWTSVTD